MPGTVGCRLRRLKSVEEVLRRGRERLLAAGVRSICFGCARMPADRYDKRISVASAIGPLTQRLFEELQKGLHAGGAALACRNKKGDWRTVELPVGQYTH